MIIVGGTHGAGKSTLCRELQECLKCEYLSPQEMAKKYPGKISKETIYKNLIKTVKKKISLNESFIYEHIMSGNFVEKLILDSQRKGFKCHLVFIDVESVDLALSRVQKRMKGGGHEAEYSKILEKLTEGRFNFWNKYKDKSTSWALFDNSLNQRRVVAFFNEKSGLNILLSKEYEIFKSESLK